ncbi:MAG: M23 family metallopeptidase [Muribaculaceae bacterium]|nr:M23 family metallopeptidase [Muribaculaceae bacterium]
MAIFASEMDYKDLKDKYNHTFRKQKVRNPARYRLDFIKENTFNRLWSVRMSRTRMWLATLAFFAAVGALLYVVFAFTPVRRLLPMKIEKDIRAGYIETSLRLDSLENIIDKRSVYNAKVADILAGRPVSDSVPPMPAAPTGQDSAAIAAREAEKQFIKSYESTSRYNVSVLAPIAAEGMDFSSPVGGMASLTRETPGPAVELLTGRATPATAVYKGNVISIINSTDGLSTIIIQHPNDFISVYGGLKEVFVEKGEAVSRGARIGHAAAPEGVLSFELWHKGAALRPDDYIAL